MEEFKPALERMVVAAEVQATHAAKLEEARELKEAVRTQALRARQERHSSSRCRLASSSGGQKDGRRRPCSFFDIKKE